MLAIARPQPRSIPDSAGGDQSVAQLNGMALAVTSQVFSGTTPHGCVYGDAEQSVEQSIECGIFRRASASPEFGSADGGVEDQRVGFTEFEPPRHQGLVPASRYFYQDVRIGKNGHRSPRRSSLDSRRSSLTCSLLSAALARDFRIPTRPCIAAIRDPDLQGIAPVRPAGPTRKSSSSRCGRAPGALPRAARQETVTSASGCRLYIANSQQPRFAPHASAPSDAVPADLLLRLLACFSPKAARQNRDLAGPHLHLLQIVLD
jgi:hypothetical protein